MDKQPHVIKLYSFLPTEVDGFDSLVEPTLDIGWRSNHPTQCGSKILLVISS